MLRNPRQLLFPRLNIHIVIDGGEFERYSNRIACPTEFDNYSHVRRVRVQRAL